MTKHAVAMVRWDIFRPGKGAYGAKVLDYGSDQERLVERVADGGTLWLITSRRRRNKLRRYHLAYKLVDCTRVDPFDSKFSGDWKYVVRAGDWRQSRHFGYNDATDTVRLLRFTTGRPMSDVVNIGLRLLSIPELTSGDVELLERLQHKIENGRSAFISYAHEDDELAAGIESELGQRDVSVSRDLTMLGPGQEWAEALQQEVTGTDCFAVLISPNAAASKWVRREVQWALNEYERGSLVTSIVPVVLPTGGWEQFPELHRFQRWEYPARETWDKAFAQLAAGIVQART
jgi:hypothetical protein